jgi:polar amino acid transport system ATP-binding protein
VLTEAQSPSEEGLLATWPCASTDPRLGPAAFDLELRDEGLTMLLVTHNMQLARQIADRVVSLDGGVIAESGPPEQIFGAPLQARTREFLQKVRSD